MGLAFWVLVFTYDIVLAYQYPTRMRLIHGIEIAADSFVYAFVLVKLFLPSKLNDQHAKPNQVSET